MKKKHILFFLVIFFLPGILICQPVPPGKQNKKKYKKWSRGVQFSYDFSYRWLSDNPRYKRVFFDTTITDAAAIEMRNSFETFKKSYTVGLIFERPINDKFFFQAGAIINNVGETVKLDNITNTHVKSYFYYDPENPVVKINYTSVDFPLAVRFTFGQKSKYDTQKSVASYLKFNRYFIGLAGIQAGYLLNNGSRFVQNGGPSFILRGIAGIGISQGLGEKATLNLLLTARHAVNPMYFDDPLNAYYYSLGVTAQLMFKKRIKEKRKAPNTSLDACILHKLKPRDPRQKLKPIFGFTFGANVSYPIGSDVNKKDTENIRVVEGFVLTGIDGHKLPLISPQWALHMEYNFFDNRAGVFSDIGFMRRGYFARYDYSFESGVLKTQTTVKQTYIDIPINIKVAVSEWIYLFAGGNISGRVNDKIRYYSQYLDNTKLDLNPASTISVMNSTDYFGKNAESFVWGYTGGIGISIGDNADFTFRVNKTSDYIKDYSLSSVNAQASLTYLFKTRKR